MESSPNEGYIQQRESWKKKKFQLSIMRRLLSCVYLIRILRLYLKSLLSVIGKSLYMSKRGNC